MHVSKIIGHTSRTGSVSSLTSNELIAHYDDLKM